MSNESSSEETLGDESGESLNRRLFVRSLGKWSGAAIIAAIAGTAWLASSPEAKAGVWVNRRGPRSSWINRGGWVNRARGWINRSPGGWINRRIGGGSSWINRW